MLARDTGVTRIFRSPHWLGLLAGGGLLLLVTLAGTLGYHYIGRPSATWVDSFYMTFITISTIGFTEVVDLSRHPWGRLFTVLIAVLGIGSMSYLFSRLVALLIDADLDGSLRRKRMEKQIAALQGHYIVCGVGRVGSNVAGELVHTGRPFVAIDSNQEVMKLWLQRHPDSLYLVEDASDDDVLKRAGVLQAAGVFALTSDDSHNLMIALSVKLLNPQVRVVVRLHDIRNENKAHRVGADQIVSPDFSGGMHIASAMLRPHVVNFMDRMMQSEEALRMEEVTVPAGMPPTLFGELRGRTRHYLLVATHEHGRWVFNPDDSHVIRPGTTLVMMTTPEGRGQMEDLLAGLVR